MKPGNGPAVGRGRGRKRGLARAVTWSTDRPLAPETEETEEAEVAEEAGEAEEVEHPLVEDAPGPENIEEAFSYPNPNTFLSPEEAAVRWV